MKQYPSPQKAKCFSKLNTAAMRATTYISMEKIRWDHFRDVTKKEWNDSVIITHPESSTVGGKETAEVLSKDYVQTLQNVQLFSTDTSCLNTLRRI